MALILPPTDSLTFLTAAIVPLIIGFIVGVIVRHAVKIGVALVVLVFILLVLGIVSPSQVLVPLLSLVQSGGEIAKKATEIAGYLPYSSVTFLIGLVIGIWKG